MAVNSAVVAVGTTATALNSVDMDGLAGQSLQFTPPSAIFVGGPGVTSATGYPLTAGVEYYYDLQPGDVYYAVAASGTVNVPVLRVGV